MIKGNLGELKNIEGYILVNYVQVDFGKEISSDEKRPINWSNSWSPCPVKNYYIKSKTAILDKEDKQEYLERVEEFSMYDFWLYYHNNKQYQETIKKLANTHIGMLSV